MLGVGRNAQSLARALELGLIDEAVSAEVAAADMILLATPVGGLRDLLVRMLPTLAPRAILTDAGSTKAEVVDVARAAWAGVARSSCPAIPSRGAERTGPEAADAGLYRGATWCSRRCPRTRRRTWRDARGLAACGATVVDMEAQAHDRVFASVSHLPHLLSAVYMEQVATAADARRRLDLAGSGFRDFTRIAAGSPEMWRDIFLSNRDAMLTELAEVRAVLDRAERDRGRRWRRPAGIAGNGGAGAPRLAQE